jgi:hypothetical protein
MTVNFLPVLPEIVVLTGASIILLVDVFQSDDRRHVSYWLTQFTLLVAACVTVKTSDDHVVRVLHNLVVDDFVADVLRLFSFVAVSLVLFYSRTYLALRDLFRGETFVLILFRCWACRCRSPRTAFYAVPAARAHAVVAARVGRVARGNGAVRGGDAAYFVLGAWHPVSSYGCVDDSCCGTLVITGCAGDAAKSENQSR